MSIIHTPNIIIKSSTPKWRQAQPTLSYFPSLHKKDSRKVEPKLHPHVQFSREELLKISEACRRTTAMGNPSLQESYPDDVEPGIEHILP